MSEKKEIEAYLRAIQSAFVTKKSNQANLSWGQFLDTTGQVGLYGTVAGALSLKTLTASVSQDALDAEAQLVSYWDNRTVPDNKNNLCQNIRLAALLLGLSFSSNNNPQKIKEVSSELCSRVIPHESMWADTNSPHAGIIASEFSTAIILIFAFAAIHFFKGPTTVFDDLNKTLNDVGLTLEKRYLEHKGKERAYLTALLVSVKLVLGKKANSLVNTALSSLSLQGNSLSHRYWHYLDYVDTQGKNKRDYFILPTNLLVPLLLMRKDIKGMHYLVSSSILDKITLYLDSNQSGLFVDPSGRPSSLEQAIVILALESSRQKKKLSWVYWSLPYLYLEARKLRSPEWIFAWIFLLGVYLPIGLIVGAEWIIKAYGTNLPNTLLNFLELAKSSPKWTASLLLLFATAIRKPNDLISSALGRSK